MNVWQKDLKSMKIMLNRDLCNRFSLLYSVNVYLFNDYNTHKNMRACHYSYHNFTYHI